MQFENTMTFVRAIKGAPASVLWALMLTQSMMTALELQQWTGYKGDNITVALRLLVDLGWVVARSPRGPWGLAEGRQLPLMSGIAQLEGFEKADSDLIGVSGVVDVDASYKMSLSSDSTTTTLTRGANPIKSDSWSDEKKACFEALKEAGIKGKKARTLLTLPWLTVEYIRAHHALVKTEFWDNPAGMMVYRMEGEEPAPEIGDAKTRYREQEIDRGKRGKEILVYTFDVDQEISDFMGHEKGCKCEDCRMLLSVHGDTRYVCSTCKHFHCTCEESEEEQ